MTQEEAECTAQKIASGERVLGFVLSMTCTDDTLEWHLQEKDTGNSFSGEMMPRKWANSVYSYSWRVE